jgi:lipid-A-disaccharide synthase-like uncharacterized protein
MDLFKFITTQDTVIINEGEMLPKKPLSIMWTERYADAGEFEIVDHVSNGLIEFLPIGTLISHTNSLEVMFVENQEVDDSKTADPVVKITGRTLEAYLENRIIGTNTVRVNSTILDYNLAANNTWNQIVLLINDHIANPTYPDDNITGVIAATNITSGTGESIARVIKRDELYRTVDALLNIDDLGIKIIRRNTFGAPDGSASQSVICVHKGNDRSNSVIFSWMAGDLEIADYLWSDKPLKTSAMVVGRYVNTIVDTAGKNNYNRKMMIVQADDIDGNLTAVPTGAALTDIVNKMRTRGSTALKNQNRITISRADISTTSKYEYRKDFSVGDIVSLNGNFGQIAKMRVTEYVEIQDENGESGHPTLSWVVSLYYGTRNVIYLVVIGIVIVICLILQIFFYIRNKRVDGEIVITKDIDNKKIFSLELIKTPEEIEKMKFIVFKVVTDDINDISQ